MATDTFDKDLYITDPEDLERLGVILNSPTHAEPVDAYLASDERMQKSIESFELILKKMRENTNK